MPDETDPEKHLADFRGKGVDVYISVDANEMRKDGIPILRSAAGVLLVPQAIPVAYFKWVQFLPQGLTIYKRVPQERINETMYEDINCACCGSRWRLGTWLCLSCWEPLHFRAVNDTFARFDKNEVA